MIDKFSLIGFRCCVSQVKRYVTMMYASVKHNTSLKHGHAEKKSLILFRDDTTWFHRLEDSQVAHSQEFLVHVQIPNSIYNECEADIVNAREIL